MLLGGPKVLTDAVKAAGGQVGPRSKWLGAWAIKSGTGGWSEFFAACKADGQTPLILWWAWGDQISPAAIKNGVQDTYQNVFKTQANLMPLLRDVMRKAKAAGVQPIVAVENEFNKNGCAAAPEFAKWFDDSVAVIRAECPGSKVLFAPGSWGDLAALAKFYAPQVAESDMVGLQCGFFKPRNAGDPATVGTYMASAFAKLGTAKSRILYDVFLSTYGGAFAKDHPFAGGDGKALETDQAKGIASLGSIPQVEVLVYRDLKDNPTFDVKNYGGYAERFVGVVRSDGTRKPSYDALMALAKPPAPAEPKTRTEAEYKGVAEARDRALFERDRALDQASQARLAADRLRAQVETARTAVNAAQAALNGP